MLHIGAKPDGSSPRERGKLAENESALSDERLIPA